MLGNDSDIDGGTLSILGTPTATNGTVTVNPDGTLNYTPNADFSGADTITYTVSDGQGGTDTGTVSVNVAEDVPVANNDIHNSNMLDGVVSNGNVNIRPGRRQWRERHYQCRRPVGDSKLQLY